MTAVIDDSHKIIDCPHCKGKLNVEIERQPATVKIQEDTTSKVMQKLQDLEERIATKPPVVEEKPKSSEIKLQSHVPGYRCGPDCQKLHKNKEYKMRPKGKCNNCSQFSNVEKGACPWCENGEIEKVDEDELDDLEIRRPDVHDHGDE